MFKPHRTCIKIENAKAQFELETHLSISVHTIEDEAHDFVGQDYRNFINIQTHHFPIYTRAPAYPAPSIFARYGQVQSLFTFPQEWLVVDKEMGRINVTPGVVGLQAVLKDFSVNRLLARGSEYIPDFFHVSYSAGFPEEKVPLLFLQCIGKMAAIEILTDQADSVYGPGKTNMSYSQDGYSQNIGIAQGQDTVPVFGGHIKQYKADLWGAPGGNNPNQTGLLAKIRDYYRGAVLFTTA